MGKTKPENQRPNLSLSYAVESIRNGWVVTDENLDTDTSAGNVTYFREYSDALDFIANEVLSLK